MFTDINKRHFDGKGKILTENSLLMGGVGGSGYGQAEQKLARGITAFFVGKKIS